ncbi:MAG: hypothetical protein REI64_06615 [Pedobacter sp.]|uniref:pirin family protein n=1 Tax=Pedobacter sp. TaxID=1411316 RepID=UPI0028088FE4|nr:hypothetical protein [Pedobacter sp.]MDQ8004457.1 hypothetical protein [Pedobacter sp.]
MNTISQGKIFLSNQRSIIESDRIKRYSTFNFEGFQNPAKEAVGNLYAIHDDTLNPNSDFNFYTRQQGYIFIVPISGNISYIDEQKNETLVEVGKSLLVYLDKNAYIQLKNRYQKETINYLMIALSSDEIPQRSLTVSNIDLSQVNHLQTITSASLTFKIGIGRYKNSGNTKYVVNSISTLYCFVLAGSFEIDGRMLNDRDGIALSATEKIEIEALSDNGLLLTIELLPKTSYILF